MNLPNKLSMLRILMIPVFMAFALNGARWAQLVAAGVFILASLTDMLDGQIARRRNLITDFGKFIDPIADKLLVMSAQVVLVGQGRLASWLCVIILAREFAVSGFRLVAASAGNVIAAENVDPNGYSFVSCATTPKFTYDAFRLIAKEELRALCPARYEELARLAMNDPAKAAR